MVAAVELALMMSERGNHARMKTHKICTDERSAGCQIRSIWYQALPQIELIVKQLSRQRDWFVCRSLQSCGPMLIGFASESSISGLLKGWNETAQMEHC